LRCVERIYTNVYGDIESCVRSMVQDYGDTDGSRTGRNGDVVDENNVVIGVTPRKGVHKTGKLHLAVHVFMFNSEGKLWIEKRGQTVDTHPGCYDSSAAGHVSSGETYDEAARMESIEELGIDGLGLKPVYGLPIGPDTKNEFVRFYVAISDSKPQLHEDAASQELYALDEIDMKIRNGEKFVPAYLLLFDWYKRNAKAVVGKT